MLNSASTPPLDPLPEQLHSPSCVALPWRQTKPPASIAIRRLLCPLNLDAAKFSTHCLLCSLCLFAANLSATTFTVSVKHQTDYLLGLNDTFTTEQLAALNVNGDGQLDVADIVYRIYQYRHVPADYPTIQAAIDAANEGDEILVAPGTYLENVNFRGMHIVLRSHNPKDKAIRESTIIDGGRNGPVVTFDGTEGCTATLAGFTLTNGAGAKYGEVFNPDIGSFGQWFDLFGGGGIHGGGTIEEGEIFPESGTRATIEYNVISESVATTRAFGYFYAFGAGLWNCNGLIQYNEIRENRSIAGAGGSGLSMCDGLIRKNLIERNDGIYGGGLSFCDGIIEGNVICQNVARYGGGIGAGSGIIQNNLIYHNHAILLVVRQT